MKHENTLLLLHGVLSLGGVALCALQREGAGTLALIMSIMCVAVLKIDSHIAPSSRNEHEDLASELSRREQQVNMMYRRAATLASLLDGREPGAGHIAPEIVHILKQIDSPSAEVDKAVQALRRPQR